ncbi:MAG: RidA family protein [Hyphomonas sp.]
MKKLLLAAVASSSLLMATGCISIEGVEGTSLAEGSVERIGIPGSDFPISSGVVIPPGAEIYYVSGIVPSIVDADADPNSRAAYGDTRQQTVSVLSRMKETMEAAGWSLGDIVMMRVYLVGDEATGGRLDFGGFMAGYSEFFATPEQPNKPARAVVEVAGLIRPGWRVEIEAQAARIPEE